MIGLSDVAGIRARAQAAMRALHDNDPARRAYALGMLERMLPGLLDARDKHEEARDELFAARAWARAALRGTADRDAALLAIRDAPRGENGALILPYTW